MLVTDKVVYLGLGGNIGDRLANLQRALELIAALPKIKDVEVSFFYETSPCQRYPSSGLSSMLYADLKLIRRKANVEFFANNRKTFGKELSQKCSSSYGHRYFIFRYEQIFQVTQKRSKSLTLAGVKDYLLSFLSI